MMSCGGYFGGAVGDGAVSSVFGRTGDVSADPGDYDALTKLDVTSTFSAGGDGLVVDAAGNVGVGTLTPANLGAGTRNLEVDSTFLSVVRLLTSGTVLGTLLAGFGQVSLSTTGDIDLTFGTDGSNRLNLLGTGEIEWPNIEGHATEGWGHVATDGTFTRSITRGNTSWVATAADFPAPVGGVITLPADTTWIVIDNVDLGSDRIECAGVVTIRGQGPETTSLSASSLAASGVLISTAYTITIHDISLDVSSGRVAIRVDGTGEVAKPACDWAYINFTGAGRACELDDVANSVNSVIACFGDGYYVYTSIGTLAFVDSFFTPSDGQCGICVESAADVITRRLRVTNCAFVLGGTGEGANVPVVSVANSEGFILSLCIFSGPTPANYVLGTTYLDEDARWIECRGVTNTGRVGEYYWDQNATATTISTTDTDVKMAGTSVAGSYNQRFTHASNRVTYSSDLVETFRVTACCSISGNNNVVYRIQAYLNGTTPIGTPQRSTTNGSGRAESFSWQGTVQLGEGDYIEMWIANESGTQNVTVEDLSVLVLQV